MKSIPERRLSNMNNDNVIEVYVPEIPKGQTIFQE